MPNSGIPAEGNEVKVPRPGFAGNGSKISVPQNSGLIGTLILKPIVDPIGKVGFAGNGSEISVPQDPD
jgi:hypothetical protein